MDLFHEVLWTLVIMETRRITQRAICAHLKRSKAWIENTLTAAVAPETLEKNLLEIDRAITEITLRRKEQEDVRS